MPLTANTRVPDFEARLHDGRTISRESLLGTKYVLYFYPKDDTPTCTKQACNLRDHYDALRSAGYEIYGVSPDDAASHMKFKEKYSLPFDLVVDEDLTLCNLFDVWGEKTTFGRTYDGVHRVTFAIDEKGVITRVIEQVKATEHHDQILA